MLASSRYTKDQETRLYCLGQAVNHHAACTCTVAEVLATAETFLAYAYDGTIPPPEHVDPPDPTPVAPGDTTFEP